MGSPQVNRRQAIATLTTAIAAPSLALAANGEPIRVGRSAPLTGMMARISVSNLDAAAVAIDEFNRQGGHRGRPIELETLDDAFDPKQTVANTKVLVEQRNVVALFGYFGTAQVGAVLPYLLEQKTPMITAVTGSPALRQQLHPYFFTAQASYVDELVKIVDNLKNVMSTRIAVVYEDNPFGQQMHPLARQVIEAKGGTLVDAQPINPDGSNARAVAEAMAGQSPHATILLSVGPAVVAFVKANKAARGSYVYTLSLSVGEAAVKALGKDARGLAVARLTPSPWRSNTPLIRRYQAAMKTAGMDINYDTLYGYANAQVLIEAIKASGPTPSRASITSGLEGLGKFNLGGMELSYSPSNHHGTNYVDLAVLTADGQFLR
ncbi:ABC transporter substrate-binding protein [Hydrogenophaga sp. 5NK40-0174]|uniref:ABC transporter substrate-binding protein n=1 Tax=Hydrogenophaga sp. 5NK40-0174 TaxID=3127649 RepID=UPI0031037F83